MHEFNLHKMWGLRTISDSSMLCDVRVQTRYRGGSPIPGHLTAKCKFYHLGTELVDRKFVVNQESPILFVFNGPMQNLLHFQDSCTYLHTGDTNHQFMDKIFNYWANNFCNTFSRNNSLKMSPRGIKVYYSMLGIT